jgi:hypothetical protein
VGYRDKDHRESRWSVKSVLGVIAGLIAFGVARVATHNGFDFVQQKTTSATRVESNFESDPRMSAAFLEFKADFPEDYHRITSDIAEQVRNGTPSAEIGRQSHDAMHNFTLAHMRQIISASDSTLDSLAAAQASVADALASENENACAQFADSGLQAGVQLSDATLQKVGETTRLMIAAAHEGTIHPIARDTSNVSDADSLALVEALRRRGITDAQLQLLMNNMQGASITDKCTVGVAVYDSMAAMAPTQSARVTAFFLAGAAGDSR